MKKYIICLVFLAYATTALAQSKISELTEDTTPTSDDLGVTVNDPSGTPVSRKVTMANWLAGKLIITDNESTAENNPICFVAGGDLDGDTTNGLSLETDGDCYYTPSTGVITCTGFAGDLTGNASTATALAANPAAATAGSCITNIAANGDVEAEVDVWTESENTSAGYIANVSEDATPTLGGDLDAGGNNITNLADVTFQTGASGGTLRTGTSAADKFQLQAYDVDNTAYVNVLELDAGNTITMEFNESGWADFDFRIETDLEDNFFYIDGGAEWLRVGDWDTNYIQITKAGVVTFAGSGDIDLPAGSVDYADLNSAIITAAAAVGTFEAGDTFLCNEAGVGVRECDYSDLPGGAETNDLETDGAAGIASGELFVGNGAGTGTYKALGDSEIPDAHSHAADAIDAITEIAAALKSGADGTVITGTAGGSGNCAEFNADGDLVEAASGAPCGSGGSGDNVAANGTGIDTTANFIDGLYGDWTLTDGGAGGPDTIAFIHNYGITLAGNPALGVDECVMGADTSGGFILCEGSTADTNEQIYRLPDANGADSTEYIVVADDTNVSAAEAGYLDGVAGEIYYVGGTDVADADVEDSITITNISQVQDITATASEINTPLDGALVTLTEFKELETVGATTISANQWAAVGGMPETLSGTELGYVDGVTSAIQTQMNGKEATVTEGSLADDTIVAADLKISNAEVNGYALTSNTGTGGFTWVELTGGAETNNLETVTTNILEGEIPIGAAGGDAVTYRALQSGDIPNNAADTSGNAATATALAANGGNCAAGSYPLGVDDAGAVESCTDATTEIDSAISTHNSDATSVHGVSDTSLLALGVSSATDGSLSCFDGTGGKQLKECTTIAISEINLGEGEFEMPNGLVSGLPGTPAVGQIYQVTDGASATDCDTGGGSTDVVCFYDGASWTAFDSGGAITIEEQDASPSGTMSTLKVTNGTLTDDGGGVFSLEISGAVPGNDTEVLYNNGGAWGAWGYYDDTNVRLGINESSPVNLLHGVGKDATSAQLVLDTYSNTAGNFSGFAGRRARGTKAAPASVDADDIIFQLAANAYHSEGTPGYTNAGKFYLRATEDCDASGCGAQWNFFTTPNNSTTSTLAMTIGQDQVVTFADNVVVSGNLTDGTYSYVPMSDGADQNLCIYDAGSLSFDCNTVLYTNLAVAAGDTYTGVHDFGGATSFELPNGASPTVDAEGECAIDTTSGQLVCYGNGEVNVFTDYRCATAIIENLAAADDNFPLGMQNYPITIIAVGLHCGGTCTTGADISLEDRAGNAMTHTVPTHSTGTNNTTYQAVTAANTLVAGEGLYFDVDNAVDPETDTYEIAYCYTMTRD